MYKFTAFYQDMNDPSKAISFCVTTEYPGRGYIKLCRLVKKLLNKSNTRMLRYPQAFSETVVVLQNKQETILIQTAS